MVLNKEYFHNDNKTRDEILENLEYGFLKESDINQVLTSVSHILDVPVFALLEQMEVTKVDINNCIKVYDKITNKIYGILIFSDFHIFKGSPILNFTEKCTQFQNTKGVNGFLFCIDKRLRGTNVHKEMLHKSIPYLSNYDYVWAGVAKNLKTHLYWKRLGFEEVFSIPEATFYKMDSCDIIKKYST